MTYVSGTVAWPTRVLLCWPFFALMLLWVLHRPRAVASAR